MTARMIVDYHFQENYNYYRQVCYRYYRGRYLFEDLLNEAYLKFIEVKDEVIFRFNKIKKLYCIGLKIIRSLYQKRLSGLKYSKCKSSPLFETPSLSYETDFIEDQSKDESEIQLYFEKASKAIETALSTPVSDEKQNPYQMVQVFLAVQESSIYRISEDTGVNRVFIKDTYKKSIEYLQKEIMK